MQLRVHEFLQPSHELPTKTFEHFLGHFFHRYMPMEDWQMELWITEDPPSEDQSQLNSQFSCKVQLIRPDKTKLQGRKKTTNLSAAIYYALKAVYKDLVKHTHPEVEEKNSNVKKVR